MSVLKILLAYLLAFSSYASLCYRMCDNLYYLHAGTVKRFTWSIGFALSLAGLTYNIVQLTTTYFSYDVTVSLNVIHSQSLIFPVVSVCNLSPLKKSAVMKQYLLRQRTSAILLSDSSTKPSKATSNYARTQGKIFNNVYM